MPIVKHSPGKGRGVFADRDYKKGEVIEVAPVIVAPNTDLSFGDYLANSLTDYVYNWGRSSFGIAGGCGSFYNHSYEPNAVYKVQWKHEAIRFKALRDIESGEEITINYNGKPTSKKRVWFEVKE